MRKVILILKNSTLRSRLTVALALAAAFLMSFIFWNTISSDETAEHKIVMGVDDRDNSALSENLAKYFTDSIGAEIISDSYDNLSVLLIDRNISAIIEVPQGFERSAIDMTPKMLEITTLDEYENSAFIQAYLNSYMSSISVISQASNGSGEVFSAMLSAMELPNTVTAAVNPKIDKRTGAADAYNVSVGFMLMIISGITVFISNQILVDRQLGTFNRMRCASLKSLEYVIGIGLFGVACCTASNLIFNLFAFSAGEELPLSLLPAIGINELFILFSVGLAILFALLADNQQTLMTVGIGYATIGSMLGGAWFPINENLGVVSNIAKLFPQYWFMDMLRNLSEDPAYNYLPNICILALSVILVYLISAVIFTRKSS